MSSLRLRLLLWVLPGTLLGAVLASVGSYWGATLSLASLLDEQLRYVASHVSFDGERLAVDRTNEPRQRLSDERADEVLTEVWQGRRLDFTSDPGLRLPPPEGPGLHDVVVAGQQWHTFAVQRGDRIVRVAQARDARWEALARIAVNLLWPVVALLPVLGACLWFGIGHGLRPLRQIAVELSRRDATGWEPVRPAPLHTELKPLVDALNALLRRLESAFQGQADFIADAAHALRTPTMALSVHAELAQSATDRGERDEALLQVRRGVARLNHLASQLLTLARVAPGALAQERRPVSLPEVCRSVIIRHLAHADAKEHELGLEARGDCVVQADADPLELMVANLVDNAIRYTPRGGRIRVALREDASGVALEVEDDGPGISCDERRRVLDRFYRGAKASEPGSGLGLAIVKRIADEHGAVLTLADATDRQGLKVIVLFPA